MTKKPFSAGYFSSYDRGLETLLDMWPEIKRQVPEATLDIYYGWQSYDVMHSKNPERMRYKWQIIRQIAALDGVTEHGRVSHEELAKAMQELAVWLYPTEFTEIHCITALKTAEAGMDQVHTGVAALMETAPNAHIVACDDISTNEAKQAEFIAEAVKALKNPKPVKQVVNCYWTGVAKVWNEVLA